MQLHVTMSLASTVHGYVKTLNFVVCLFQTLPGWLHTAALLDA